MTKSPAEQFLEIAENDRGSLTNDLADELDRLLKTHELEKKSDWASAAHFLLASHYSGSSETDDRLISHFAAFLNSAERPCESLVVDGEEIALYVHADELWAAFAYGEEEWGQATRESTDLCGFALDQMARVYYRDGNFLDAAESLELVLTNPPGDDLSYSDDSRLLGWIGWLYFEASEYARAAEYLQKCWDRIPQYVDRDSSSEVTNEFVAFTEWYMMYGSLPNNSDIHAFTEMGDSETFLPSGSLAHGCDAFLMQLAISHASIGNYEQAFKAADLCVRFGEPLQDLHFDCYQDFQPVPFPEVACLV